MIGIRCFMCALFTNKGFQLLEDARLFFVTEEEAHFRIDQYAYFSHDSY